MPHSRARPSWRTACSSLRRRHDMSPSSSANFEVSTIATREELLQLADEWSQLLERSDNVLPFMLPGWLIPWWDTYRQERRLIRDSLRIKVVRRAGQVVGILPFMLTERPPSGPLRARAMGFLGADPYITEQRAPLYDRTCASEVARAIADDLQGDPEWDWIGWAGLDRESEFASALEARMPLRWKSSDTANILTLPSTWEAFRFGSQAQRQGVAPPWLQLAQARGIRASPGRGRDRCGGGRGPRHVLRSAHGARPGEPRACSPGSIRSYARAALPRRGLSGSRGAARHARVHAAGGRQAGSVADRFRPAGVPVPLLLGLRPDLGSVRRDDHDRGGGHQVRHRARCIDAASVHGSRCVQDALGWNDAGLARRRQRATTLDVGGRSAALLVGPPGPPAEGSHRAPLYPSTSSTDV